MQSRSDIMRQRKRILDRINALKAFPNTKTVMQLRKELRVQLDAIERQAERQEEQKVIRSKRQKREAAKLSRSNKLRKYHNYLRQIRNNYPDINYGDIRKMFKLRKQGKEVEVPDVIWQNPSP